MIVADSRRNHFLREVSLPKIGIVCSNWGRADRISKIINIDKVFEDPWGPKIYVGNLNKLNIFVASVPIGSGCGLYFTEFFNSGAKIIVRFGTNDTPPFEPDREKVKLVRAVNNLYGFSRESGIENPGGDIQGSKFILEAFLAANSNQGDLIFETVNCTHVENFYALQYPDMYPPDRAKRIKSIFNTSGNCHDMETAILYQCAEDFGAQALTILQTVNKNKSNPYDDSIVLNNEKNIAKFILNTLGAIHV